MSSGGAEPASDGSHLQINRSSEAPQSDTAVAPQRRKARLPKVIALDYTTELRNRDLLSMSNTYLARMAGERQALHAKKAAKQAKHNPHHWILDGGINYVGYGIGKSHGKTPLSYLFSGNALFEFATGRTLETRGKKRESEGDESTFVQRRVRSRVDGEDQVGRGGESGQHEDDFPTQVDDVEIGRDASVGDGDVSNFPWNVTASVHGSSVQRGLSGSAPGLPGSVAGSLGRRGNRMVSASPLHGRARFSDLEPLIVTEGFESDVMLGNEFGAYERPSGDTEFEMYDPEANPSTQTATRMSGQQPILDQQSANFLGFIASAIDERHTTGNDARSAVDNVEFEELLLPHANSQIVAAQALLHVLTLATKNFITASQLEEYGAIELRLIQTQ
jgi:meiotic recombination protein REC8